MAMNQKDLIALIRRISDPIFRSVQLLVGRAVLEAINDSKGIQVAKVSVLSGETMELERMQNYGFTSVPGDGAEGLCVFAGGNREHGICIVMDDRTFRLKNLGKGQVALYDKSGTNILLSNDGKVKVTAATDVTVEAPAVKLGSGVLEKIINGETFQEFFNNHVHIGAGPGNVTTAPTILSNSTHLSTKITGAK